ncbi:hypothetical protein MKEN_00621900 [Mycena kentingensis (nom. inval.)]|nr:hypothetical protein MKEN_00621900 [Mycena kentingensis (nom. inval.)]
MLPATTPRTRPLPLLLSGDASAALDAQELVSLQQLAPPGTDIARGPGATMETIGAAFTRQLEKGAEMVARIQKTGPRMRGERVYAFLKTELKRRGNRSLRRVSALEGFPREDCSKLVKYASRRKEPHIQYSAFHQIVTLCAQYPALGEQFLASEYMPANCRTQAALLAAWDRPDDPACDHRWRFFCELAAAFVTDDVVRRLVHRRSRQFICDAVTEGATVVEHLLNIAAASDGDNPFTAHIAIRYLKTVLSWSTFWNRLEVPRNAQHQVERDQSVPRLIGKLLDRARSLLEDVGLDATQSAVTTRQSSASPGGANAIRADEEGIDKYCLVLLRGLEHAFIRRLPLDRLRRIISGEVWYSNLENVVTLLRCPDSHLLAPQSSALVLGAVYLRCFPCRVEERSEYVEADSSDSSDDERDGDAPRFAFHIPGRMREWYLGTKEVVEARLAILHQRNASTKAMKVAKQRRAGDIPESLFMAVGPPGAPVPGPRESPRMPPGIEREIDPTPPSPPHQRSSSSQREDIDRVLYPRAPAPPSRWDHQLRPHSSPPLRPSAPPPLLRVPAPSHPDAFSAQRAIPRPPRSPGPQDIVVYPRAQALPLVNPLPWVPTRAIAPQTQTRRSSPASRDEDDPELTDDGSSDSDEETGDPLAENTAYLAAFLHPQPSEPEPILPGWHPEAWRQWARVPIPKDWSDWLAQEANRASAPGPSIVYASAARARSTRRRRRQAGVDNGAGDGIQDGAGEATSVSKSAGSISAFAIGGVAPDAPDSAITGPQEEEELAEPPPSTPTIVVTDADDKVPLALSPFLYSAETDLLADRHSDDDFSPVDYHLNETLPLRIIPKRSSSPLGNASRASSLSVLWLEDDDAEENLNLPELPTSAALLFGDEP